MGDDAITALKHVDGPWLNNLEDNLDDALRVPGLAPFGAGGGGSYHEEAGFISTDSEAAYPRCGRWPAAVPSYDMTRDDSDDGKTGEVPEGKLGHNIEAKADRKMLNSGRNTPLDELSHG